MENELTADEALEAHTPDEGCELLIERSIE
jgi:hypothetical protein